VVLAAAAGLLGIPQVRVSGLPREPAPLLASQYPEQQIFEERVDDEVVYAAVARGVEREAARGEAARMVEALGLGGAGLLRRRTWDLSSGERRLVQLVGTLIAPAPLLLLDEPTCGLDPARREALGGLIVRRAASDPILIASQDGAWLRAIRARTIPLHGIAPKTASYGKKWD
jgi:energy-coupling factor transporter ATP-binding protein EcfA2